ncbi:AfsR/SARP family transcriptional regulator [Actinomadura sp. HBU206391]|uniref:AfsR/SARP family transcriptional regulator n=1 Tax=Actinomadura sp. HBU206391 TaxID=2731692 RepID=UPI001650C3EE|nr:AfsR/SARP family transcriptional regulator [Actinomadura sp. HBU206391]MBC6462475.1 AfsR/SARP family transcriptional regulator [Actinomadura sp. HBU206391]
MTAPTVEFGLLGPLKARVGGRPVEFGSPKHRNMLAALLLNARRPVPIGDLAYAVWGAETPEQPRRAIQLYVTRIRALLGGGQPGQVIVTHRGGYAIETPADQLDLGRFEFWHDRARRAAVGGDLDEEAAALRRALAQWRGEPLADVPSEVLHRETVPRLREQRLRVLERRIEVDLRRGRHTELVGELFELAAKHPLQERLWVHLMTALHAGGRRADALAAYHTVRRHLAEELGIDPGEELRTLQAEILADGARPGRKSGRAPGRPSRGRRWG